MKQFTREAFLDCVRTWGKKHNIYGNVDPGELLNQASEGLSPELGGRRGRLLVDVGAGAGWLAAAWLLLSQDNRSFAIEPDTKSASFLLFLRSSFPDLKDRFFVDDRRFEHVPRETIAKIDPEFFLVSRAFSPAEQLEPLYRKSSFRSDPMYVFFYDRSLPKGKRTRLQPIL